MTVFKGVFLFLPIDLCLLWLGVPFYLLVATLSSCVFVLRLSSFDCAAAEKMLKPRTSRAFEDDGHDTRRQWPRLYYYLLFIRLWPPAAYSMRKWELVRRSLHASPFSAFKGRFFVSVETMTPRRLSRCPYKTTLTVFRECVSLKRPFHAPTCCHWRYYCDILAFHIWRLPR